LSVYYMVTDEEVEKLMKAGGIAKTHCKTSRIYC